VPLTFTLTANTPPTRVPSGTQAGTQAGILFETEDDLTVVPARITQAFTMDPFWDLFTDQTPVLSGQNPSGFTPFVGIRRMPHVLYLGDEELLNFRNATIVVSFAWQPFGAPDGISLSELQDFLKDVKW